jgi:response regulator RpfG family c-di-GMP phosphodiesterase
LGAHDFLTKPFQMDELLLVVRNAAVQVRLRIENDTLRRQIGELIGSLARIEREHGELIEHIRQMDYETGPVGIGSDATGTPVDDLQARQLRRRRMREQLATYLRMGETIEEQLNREHDRIEGLFRDGLLSEDSYRQALEREGQHSGNAPPAPPES